MVLTQCVNKHLEDILMGRGKKVKELRDMMGMNRREFSDYFGIPYRTVQDWETEKRELPDYVLRLMWYRAAIEKKIDVTEKQL
jgi:DNA-binding transcriptional regulator YiaG